MKVVILGSGAAVPSVERGASSVAVQINRECLLFDCGEGTQVQMQRFKVKWGRANHIFISHLHGDHYFGLPGLLFTYHLYNRKKPLHIYCHAALEPIISHLLNISLPHLSYPLVYHFIEPGTGQVLLQTKYFTVEAFPLVHRIESSGFLIRTVEGERRIRPGFIEKYDPDRTLLRGIQHGNDYTDPEGNIVPNHEITLNGRRPVSFAFISDTSFYPPVAEKIHGVDLLYHEATFPAEEADNASAKGHSTSADAAEIAKMASAGLLVLGHLSARIHSVEQFEDQAKAIFPNSVAAYDGDSYEICP